MGVYSGTSRVLEEQGYKPVYEFRDLEQALGFGKSLRDRNQVEKFKVFDQGLGNQGKRFVLFGRQ